MIKQKLDYIHDNPVAAGFITQATQWKYGSARNIVGEDPVFLILSIGKKREQH